MSESTMLPEPLTDTTSSLSAGSRSRHARTCHERGIVDDVAGASNSKSMKCSDPALKRLRRLIWHGASP